MAASDTALSVLRGRPDWLPGCAALRSLVAAYGDAARTDAAEHGDVYKGDRASMVFDVVASRQRRYEARVLPMVREFRSTGVGPELRGLSEAKQPATTGLRQGEWDTMRSVAAGLLRYGIDAGESGDDATCLSWATSVGPLDLSPKLDPYVGSVKGIGPALFAYLRMRSGADALKPDLRVTAGLQALGFEVPDTPTDTLVLAKSVAEEAGLPLLVLDQLLWRATETDRYRDLPRSAM